MKRDTISVRIYPSYIPRTDTLGAFLQLATRADKVDKLGRTNFTCHLSTPTAMPRKTRRPPI
jgi:hypothetical protein